MTVREAAKPWPEDELERVPGCPLCGSADRALIHSGLEDRIFFAAPGQWSLWRCLQCRSAWLDPRPTEASIGLAYSRYYTHEDGGTTLPTSRLAKFRARLGNGYRNHRYGTRLEPASSLGRWAALFPPFRWPVDAAYRFLPRARSGHGRVLDIGCGNGGFLLAAKEAGWQVMGIEPDRAARAAAEVHGITVVPTLSSLPGDGKPFDYVTISHVIEHVHDPRALLAQVFALLRPGGGLFVDTPNFHAVGHRIYGRHWRGLEPPRHVILFNRASLREALARAGLVRVRFHPRTDALAFTATHSRRIAADLDPYGYAKAPSIARRPTLLETLQAVIGSHSEFLTVTAAKPQ